MRVKIKVVTEGLAPAYSREQDACMDCYARLEKETTLLKDCRMKIPLGFCLEVPYGWKAEILGRSGNNLKGIEVIEGTIDCGYRGEVSAIVVNKTGKDIKIGNQQRICQMDFVKVPKIKWVVKEELSESERGSNGFGSSGK